MDVHKDSINIAIPTRGKGRHYGRIAGDAASVDKAVRKLRGVHRNATFVCTPTTNLIWLGATRFLVRLLVPSDS